MIGKIVEINSTFIKVKLSINIYQSDNLIGKYVIFGSRYVGEVISCDTINIDVNLVGEIVNNRFIVGSGSMPPFGYPCCMATENDINVIYGIDKSGNVLKVGKSSIYNNYDVYLNIDSFFSNHFCIFGNSGSGKSHFVARLLQGIFYDAKKLPYNTNIFLFDAYGEYQRAFEKINMVNPNLGYKVITTDLKERNFELLSIPFWLLTTDDICLLLDVDDVRQISIIEKALKLVSYFANDDEKTAMEKNDIIARCLLDIIYSSANHMEVRNRLVTVLSQFGTKLINLDINLTKGGWSRTIRQCIYVDENGKFADIEVFMSYLEQFCTKNYELCLPDGSIMYSINDFAKALEFALISEGIFSSNRIFEYANILKTRLNSLINSDYVRYFECHMFMNKDGYIRRLLTGSAGTGKCQIINFNINYVSDRFAKVLVKIYSRLLFDYIVSLPVRASVPFHIVLEEAHRYVQDDIDRKILGYNIFDRIAKEGRKYGILLGLISQRPSELSETAVSQCSNFAIFKIFHPLDIQFVSSAISGVSSEMINRIKVLNSGTCVLFGTAFKFPIITMVDMPSPPPLSENCDINKTWYIE